MRLAPRFLGRLGVADVVTVGNAALGFLAAIVATLDPWRGAQLILLAAVADGLDGLLARRYGGTPAGPYLDSLADVASFAVAPAVLLFVVARDGWGITTAEPSVQAAVALGVPALFVAVGVVRLGLYTAYDTADHHTYGVPTTLAATIVGAAVLAEVTDPIPLYLLAVVFCYLMVAPIRYPDLLARDALIMGVVHCLAVAIPGFGGGVFPVALLTLAVVYLFFGPRFYWGDAEREGKRS